MPTCQHPQCHEEMITELRDKVPWGQFQKLRDCVAKKTPRSWVWIGFVILGLPLLGIGATVWSKSKHSDDVYISHKEMEKHVVDISACKENTRHMKETLKDIKASQRETRRDVKDILKFLRGR